MKSKNSIPTATQIIDQTETATVEMSTTRMAATNWGVGMQPAEIIPSYGFAPVDGGMSDKYVTINTDKLIHELTKRGFVMRDSFRRSNAASRHVIRMRAKKAHTLNGEKLFPEIEMHNSYNGKCSFKCQMGIFRQICTNGLTVLATEYGETKFRIRHMGTEAEIADQITLQFIDSLPAIWNVHERLATTMLTDEQMIDLAQRAAELRWKQKFTPEQTAALLTAARKDDAGNSAWHVFNRLQENIIQGGIKLDGMKRTPKPMRDAWKNHLS